MRPEFELRGIKLLRLLEQPYITHSVTRAAEALGQSQPTVSIWLGRLRAQLGDPLFVPTAGGMLPTPRTDALIGTVREVLDGLQRRFSICMTDARHITLRPRLLAHVRCAGGGARRVAAGQAALMRNWPRSCKVARSIWPWAFCPGWTPAFTSARCMPRTGSAWPTPSTRACGARGKSTGAWPCTSRKRTSHQLGHGHGLPVA